MTRDDIIRMAEEAGFQTDLQDVWITYDGIWSEEFERFAALVAAAEREACAKVCETAAKALEINREDIEPMPRTVAIQCAAAIRARGEV